MRFEINIVVVGGFEIEADEITVFRNINAALKHVSTRIAGDRRIGKWKVIEQILRAGVYAIPRDDVALKLQTGHRI